ncbi:hypothetical protein THTE_4477 [Thermogutta terrifontis]|uniref:Uncharacterized protein n=1 Tax=Thermogutta terrifontis TaxID=1331910 RepID=A0A286RM83_9BACT|nr:hypothetical protein THTE_4477 [Thermogutta terrifontis]
MAQKEIAGRTRGRRGRRPSNGAKNPKSLDTILSQQISRTVFLLPGESASVFALDSDLPSKFSSV